MGKNAGPWYPRFDPIATKRLPFAWSLSFFEVLAKVSSAGSARAAVADFKNSLLFYVHMIWLKRGKLLNPGEVAVVNRLDSPVAAEGWETAAGSTFEGFSL